MQIYQLFSKFKNVHLKLWVWKVDKLKEIRNISKILLYWTPFYATEKLHGGNGAKPPPKIPTASGGPQCMPLIPNKIVVPFFARLQGGVVPMYQFLRDSLFFPKNKPYFANKLCKFQIHKFLSKNKLIFNWNYAKLCI